MVRWSSRCAQAAQAIETETKSAHVRTSLHAQTAQQANKTQTEKNQSAHVRTPVDTKNQSARCVVVVVVGGGGGVVLLHAAIDFRGRPSCQAVFDVVLWFVVVGTLAGVASLVGNVGSFQLVQGVTGRLVVLVAAANGAVEPIE